MSGAHTPPIATRAELGQRLAARPKPAPQRHLTPSGWEAMETRRQVDTANENRIAKLRESLGNAHNKMSTDHRMVNLQGTAKADFGRSR